MTYEYEKKLKEKKNQDRLKKFSRLIDKYAADTNIENAISMALEQMNSRRD